MNPASVPPRRISGRYRELVEAAESVGLYVAYFDFGLANWRNTSNKTSNVRYRFFHEPRDYYDGGELVTCHGMREAMLFVAGAKAMLERQRHEEG